MSYLDRAVHETADRAVADAAERWLQVRDMEPGTLGLLQARIDAHDALVAAITARRALTADINGQPSLFDPPKEIA